MSSMYVPRHEMNTNIKTNESTLNSAIWFVIFYLNLLRIIHWLYVMLIVMQLYFRNVVSDSCSTIFSYVPMHVLCMLKHSISLLTNRCDINNDNVVHLCLNFNFQLKLIFTFFSPFYALIFFLCGNFHIFLMFSLILFLCISEKKIYNNKKNNTKIMYVQ